VSTDCPALWHCRADERCWVDGDPDAGASDGGPPADAGCTPTSPTDEVCDGRDNDCDGVVDGAEAAASCGDGTVCVEGACVPRHEWSVAVGSELSTSLETPSSIGFDADGNVYVAGGLEAPANFGGATLSPASDDWFVVSYDRAGAHRWSRIFGGALVDGVWSLAVGGDRIVIAGETHGSFSLDDDDYSVPDTGVNDVIAELDAGTGAVVWSRYLSGTGRAAVASDDAGNAYVLTVADAQVNLAGYPIGSADHPSFVFASFARDGSPRWSRAEGRPAGDVTGVLVELVAPIVVPGVVQFAVTATIDDASYGAPGPIGTGPIVIASYATGTGTFLSAHRFGHNEGSSVTAQVGVGSGSWIVGEQVGGDIDPVASGGYAARFDGTELTSFELVGTPIASSGNHVYVAGATGAEALVFGASTIPGSSAFFGEVDSTGSPIWGRDFAPGSWPTCATARGSRLALAVEMAEPHDLGGGIRVGRIAIAEYSF
jgi:hypothetical protein